jgi:kinetochor protein Mis14/NSL1
MEPSSELLNSLLTSSAAEGRSIEEHEPFNPKLWERAKELARQEEDLIEEIAALRRKMPGVAVEGLKKNYKDGMEDDEVELRTRAEGVREREGNGAELGVRELQRQAEVERNWNKAIDGLGRLRRTMPEMVAKKERAERAERYVLTAERK